MTSFESSSPSPKFKTRKEFMEFLGDLLVSRIEPEPEDFSGETRGRPRLLKTYLMEANSKLPSNLALEDIRVFREETKIPEISILNLIGKSKRVRFYVDTSD